MADPVAKEALDRALDEDNLVLVYQPIHDARTRRVVAAEALLRQRRATGETREAAIIAKTAEKRGGEELYALDSFVVRRAYTDAARWQAQGAGDVLLNVNLSPREFQEGHVLNRLTSLVTSCDIDPRKVNLEITETSYIKHPEETMHVLNELKELGVALWLDDFGTGHSSITHLQHFPLDGIKLPGSFIEGIPHERRCISITRALIGLAHDLGLKVIAEGVEKPEQLDFLLDQQCEWIQGFLFSKPMALDEFVKFVA